MPNKSAGQLSVLIDADALVALAKVDDTNHKLALDLHRKLEQIKAIFYISPFTIPEVSTVLSYKVSHQAALEFLRAARNSEFVELEFTMPVRNLSDKWFSKQTKKGVAYFDCVNMALFEYYRLDAIFSFDGIYKKNVFKIVNEII